MSKVSTPLPPKPSITIGWVFVTPEMAVAWLTGSAANRTLSVGRVAAMADDHAADKFIPTHQGVAFDVSNNLCDGQHRLSAIVKSDKGMWLLVAQGLPTGAMEVIDSGRNRSLADRARISAGWEHSTTVMSIARILANHELGHRASDQQVMTMARREIANIDAIVSNRKQRYVSYGPIGAACVYARPISPDKIDAFVDLLLSGANLAEGSPVLALRNYYDRAGLSKGGSEERTSDFRRALSALRAFVRGDEKFMLKDSAQGLDWVTNCRAQLGLKLI